MEHCGINMNKINLPSKIIDKLVKDIMPLIIKLYYHDELICHNCARNVPNENWFTEEGCLWCLPKLNKE